MNIYELFADIATKGEPRDFQYLNIRVTKEQYEQIDDKNLFVLISNIMTLYIDYKDPGASFGPAYIWEDGRKSFAPEDISDDDVIRLSQLDFAKLPLVVNAQIYDVLWDIKGDYKAALLAADAYFELFDILYAPEKWTSCMNMLKRAVILAARLNDSARLNKYLNHAYNLVISLNGSDTLFFSTQIIQLLIRQKYNCDYNALLPIADNLIAGNKDNDIRLKEAYVTNAGIYRKLGKIEDANAVMIAYAEELILLADTVDETTFNDIVMAEKHLQQAIGVLQDYGQSADEANRKLVAVQKKLVKGLNTHEFKMDISETVTMINSRYSGNLSECLMLLAVDVPWMEVEKTKQDVILHVKQHPLQNLFIKTNLNKDGNITAIIPTIDIADPEKDQDALFANMYAKARQNEEIYAQIALLQVLSIIRSKDFSEESLNFVVKDNLLIPEGREDIFRTGLYLGFTGKYYEALHILAPQMENLFRRLAENCGDVVVVSSKDGIQQAIPLGFIFDRENLKLCYDENILFTFQGLMEKKEGSNIRNLIGHGLMDSIEVGYAGVYFICAVYKLLFYNSKSALEEFKDYSRQKNGKTT